MSLQNILRPESKNEEWTNIYCNSLTSNRIIGPSYNNVGLATVQSLNSVILGTLNTFPLFSSYGLPGGGDTKIDPVFYNYIQGGGITIIKKGYYRVTGSFNLQMTNASNNNYFELLVNGELRGSSCSSAPSVQAGGISVNFSKIILLEIADIITVGCSTGGVLQSGILFNSLISIEIIEEVE